MDDKLLLPCLDNDVMLEIFRRTPADILHHKLKYQSKQWFNIISNPDFFNLHLHEVGILERRVVTLKIGYFITINFMDLKGLETGNSRKLIELPRRITLHSVANGLILYTDKVSKSMFVSNPSTKETILLPPFELKGNRINGWELVYVSSTKKFKLIEVVCKYSYGVYVQTLGAPVGDSLIAIPWRLPLYMYKVYDQRVVIDGILYMFHSSYNIMGYIDVKCETKAVAGSLHWPKADSCHSCLTVIDGMLAVIQRKLDNGFEFWFLKNIKTEEWDCKLRIGISYDLRSKLEDFDMLRSFNNGEVLCFQEPLKVTKYILFYVKTKEWKEITRVMEPDVYSSKFYDCSHVNSLQQPINFI